MDKKINVEYLARYLPASTGIEYHAIAMTPDEIAERRAYIRKMLIGSSFRDKTNDELDRSMYYELGSTRIFEDEKGHCYAIRSSVRGADAGEFRKARAMIPFEYKTCKAKDFKWTLYGGGTDQSQDILNKFLIGFERMRENGMGLYIHSKTRGSGKTMLACCLLNELAERHAISVKFINVLDLLDMTKKSYSSELDDLKAIHTANVLVLDDIGVQMNKEWVDTVFYQLINQRYTEHKITIYTSNVAANDLKMDERIKDRIISTSYMIGLPEVAIRQQQAEKRKKEIFENTLQGAANTPQGNVTRQPSNKNGYF